MFTGIVVGALSAAALLQPTDTIVSANGASRFELESFQGRVVVRTWDRDAVQVEAELSEDQAFDVERSGNTISVEPDFERGMGLAHPMDLEVTVPRAFDLSIEGVMLDVDVEGIQGSVEVSTVNGPIRVSGGSGSISLASVNGTIDLEGATGDMEITGVAGAVIVRDCSGDLHAESIGGSMTLEGIRSSDVEVGTVGGTLRFDGAIADGGRYNFGSHVGEIWLHLPTTMNAEVEVVTLAGDIAVDFPGAPEEATTAEGYPGLNKREMSFQVGNGSARIEVETFGGTVHIQRRGG
jgi:DUF4097 and DUF4098 domain-containing protein YvlB